MRVVQHFDQAVFKLKALIQQGTELFEFGGKSVASRVVVFSTALMEGQSGFSTDIDARVDVLGEFNCPQVVKGFGFFGELREHGDVDVATNAVPCSCTTRAISGVMGCAASASRTPLLASGVIQSRSRIVWSGPSTVGRPSAASFAGFITR